MTAYSQGEYTRLVEESLKNSGVEESEIEDLQEGEEELEEQEEDYLPPEVHLENRRRALLGVYTDREVYGPFFASFHERFGAYRVMDAYGYTVDTSVLSDTRVRKSMFADLVWEEKDFFTKLFGFEYADMITPEEIYDLENDFPAIFFFCGYVGFALYLLFFAYFGFILLRAFWWKLKDAAGERPKGRPVLWHLQVFWDGLRRYLTLEMGAVGMTFLLATIAAQISGNVLRRPNVTVYFAAAAACIYFLAVEQPKRQRGELPSQTERF